MFERSDFRCRGVVVLEQCIVHAWLPFVSIALRVLPCQRPGKKKPSFTTDISLATLHDPVIGLEDDNYLGIPLYCGRDGTRRGSQIPVVIIGCKVPTMQIPVSISSRARIQPPQGENRSEMVNSKTPCEASSIGMRVERLPFLRLFRLPFDGLFNESLAPRMIGPDNDLSIRGMTAQSHELRGRLVYFLP